MRFLRCTTAGEPRHSRMMDQSLVRKEPESRPRAPFISPDHPSYKWWVAATVMLGAFFVVVSGTAVNVALPQMMTTFGMNLDEVQWVITAYMIASAVLIPTVGWLGNRLGNRNLFLVSLLMFIASSALCGLAWSGGTLIFFRVLQGIGGGPLMPMTMVLLNDAFPVRERGLAMGLFGLAAAFGPAVGPALGGYLTDYVNWRAVFYLNLVPGVVCMALVWLVIPNARESSRRSLDLPGLVTLAVFLVSLLTALSQGNREGWDSPYIRQLFVVAGVTFAAFLVLELWRKEPLVELRLYTNMAFSIVSLVILINAMNFWGTGLMQTILLQRAMDYTPAQAGFMVLPAALVMAITTLGAGRLADTLDRRILVLFGLGLFALSSYWFSYVTLDTPMHMIIWMIVGRYFSIAFIFTPMNAASLMTLPPEKVRMGSGLINIMQQGLGGTTGIAIMTTFLERRVTYHADMLDQQQALSPLRWSEILAPVREFVAQAGEVGAMEGLKSLGLLRQYLLQEATLTAYQDTFLLMMALGVLVMPLVFFMRRPSHFL
ncbi:MAG: DHA2 family efflux MFS transporter permease subunit [Nitrospinae bacterium]|nr:DHA2 family efflux MFS transporter permease subunit [Nitrospinota bacterium]